MLARFDDYSDCEMIQGHSTCHSTGIFCVFKAIVTIMILCADAANTRMKSGKNANQNVADETAIILGLRAKIDL